MKQRIKDCIADIVYCCYRYVVKKSTVKVYSIDETLEELLNTEKSLVRFGDGEVIMIKGKSLRLQTVTPELTDGLRRILGYEHEGLMVTVQGIFDGVENYHKKSRQFWKDHLLFCRGIYKKYCNQDKTYGDTAVTRCYYAFEDKKDCAAWFERFRQVWKGKKVVVVEGCRTHNGVGNDLLSTAAGVERIICPPKDAYAVYDKILEACKTYPLDTMFLVSLGVTAKFLTEDLFLAGYRVIDIGNLDMEYEWFLQGAQDKVPVRKHEITGDEANRQAGYEEYLQQIKVKIEEKKDKEIYYV